MNNNNNNTQNNVYNYFALHTIQLIFIHIFFLNNAEEIYNSRSY